MKIINKFKWWNRKFLLPKKGQGWKQTADLKGILLDDGTYIPYGKAYYKAYFKGIIKDKGLPSIIDQIHSPEPILNKCTKCASQKSPDFYFKLNNTWTVKCTTDYCYNRWNYTFSISKKNAASQWNSQNKA